MSVIDTRTESVLKIEAEWIIDMYHRIVEGGDLRSLKRMRRSVVFLPRFKDANNLGTSRSECRHLSIHALPEKRLNHMLVPVGDEIAHLGNLMPIHIIKLIHELI